MKLDNINHVWSNREQLKFRSHWFDQIVSDDAIVWSNREQLIDLPKLFPHGWIRLCLMIRSTEQILKASKLQA